MKLEKMFAYNLYLTRGYYSKYIRNFYNTKQTNKNSPLILKWAEVLQGWGDGMDRVKGLGSLMVAPRSNWEGRRSWEQLPRTSPGWEQPQLLGQGQVSHGFSEAPMVPIFSRSLEFVVMGAVAVPLPSPHPSSPWAWIIPPPVVGPRCLVCSSSCICHTTSSFIFLHLGWHRHQDVQLSDLPPGSQQLEHSLPDSRVFTKRTIKRPVGAIVAPHAGYTDCGSFVLLMLTNQ